MMATMEVSKAASVLGLSEEVITNFLYLVNSLERQAPEKRVTSFSNTQHNAAAAMEALMNEYVTKL